MEVFLIIFEIKIMLKNKLFFLARIFFLFYLFENIFVFFLARKSPPTFFKFENVQS